MHLYIAALCRSVLVPTPAGIVILCLVAAGAHSTWFHLYRLVLEQPQGVPSTAQEGLGEKAEAERVQQVALAVEQFLQTSTVGEYEQRLSMVWSFRFVLCSCPPPGGEGQGGGGVLSAVCLFSAPLTLPPSFYALPCPLPPNYSNPEACFRSSNYQDGCDYSYQHLCLCLRPACAAFPVASSPHVSGFDVCMLPRGSLTYNHCI